MKLLIQENVMKSLIKLSLLALVSMGGVEGSAAAERLSEENISSLSPVSAEERLRAPSSSQASQVIPQSLSPLSSLSIPSLHRSDQHGVDFFPLPKANLDRLASEEVATPIESYQNNTINVKIIIDGRSTYPCSVCLREVEPMITLYNIKASDTELLGDQIIAALKSQLIFKTQDIKAESAKLSLTTEDEAAEYILGLLARTVRDLDTQLNYNATIWRTMGRSADAVLFMIVQGLVKLTATFDTLIACDDIASLSDHIDLSLSLAFFLKIVSTKANYQKMLMKT